MKNLVILGIETSCDETTASVVNDRGEILSNIVYSQIEYHREFGGVVPEIASRKHLEVINNTIDKALSVASVKARDLQAIAVTVGPGLIGALLIGVATAKSLAYTWGVPLIGVNHVISHIWANFLTHNELKPPLMALVVSGGHTSIIFMQDCNSYSVIGETLDDAAGEAFDKIAKYLKLGYPGGPIIDELAKDGNKKSIDFPRPLIGKGNDFSLSGLKTAVLNYIQKEGKENIFIPDLCASFQEAVVEVLVVKTLRACEKFNIKKVAVAGGVAANTRLREFMLQSCDEKGFRCFFPKVELCTDNAAMIAAAAFPLLRKREFIGIDISPKSNLPVC